MWLIFGLDFKLLKAYPENQAPLKISIRTFLAFKSLKFELKEMILEKNDKKPNVFTLRTLEAFP